MPRKAAMPVREVCWLWRQRGHTGPHRSGPNVYPITNNEIINVPTISESSNLSEIGSIAPAGAEDEKVVFNTRTPESIVRYHFLPVERF